MFFFRCYQELLLNNFLSRSSEDAVNKRKEYASAQEFYESLPGVKENMLSLLPPSTQQLCINMLNPYQHPPIKENLIAPHLCKVTTSEPILCFCEKSYSKKEVRKIYKIYIYNIIICTFLGNEKLLRKKCSKVS